MGMVMDGVMIMKFIAMMLMIIIFHGVLIQMKQVMEMVIRVDGNDHCTMAI